MRRALVMLSLWMGVGLKALAADPSAGSAPPATVVLPEVAASPEELPRDKPNFTAKITFDNAVGSGVLESNQYSQNPSYTINFYFNPAYEFTIGGHKLKAQAWEGLTLYPRLDNNATTNRRVDWTDLRLILGDSKIYEEPHSHIKFGANLRGIVPVSYTSRYATMITALTLGVNLSKSFYRLDVAAGFGFQKNFFRLTSVAAPCPPGTTPILLNSGLTADGYNGPICRTGDTMAPVKATAMNADFTLIPSISGTYHFSDKLSASILFTYLDSFLYPVPVDGFSSGAIDKNGQPVVQSQGRVDSVYAITSVDYALDSHWGLSLGILNNTSPRNPGGNSYNFPIADISSLATNSFVMFFDISASI